MSRFRILLATSVAVAATLLPAAGYAADLAPLIVAEPTTAATYLLPLFVAQDTGWYQNQGLKLEEKTVVGDVVSLRAVISSDADITDIGLNTAQQAFGNGLVKIIGSTQPIVDYRVIAKIGAGSDLKALADKRWAISGAGGMLQAIPKMLMAKAGIDPSNAQFVPVGGLAARYQAVVGGTVDASLVDTSLAVMGTEDKKTQLVRSVAQDFPGLAYVYLVTSGKALKDPAKQKAMETFIAGIIYGTRVIMEDPTKAAQIMEARLKDNRVAMMTEVLKEMNALGVWGQNGGLERPVYDFSAKMYHDSGDVPDVITYEQIVDTSLVDVALKTLGKK